MAIEIGALASTIVTSFLLPYAKEGLEKFAGKVADELGQEASRNATSIIGKVVNKVKEIFNTDDDKQTLAQFEKRPDAAKSLVETVLKEKLAENPAAAAELQQLVNSPISQTQGGAQITAAEIAGIVQIGVVSGDHATIGGVIIGERPKKDKPQSDEPDTNER